MTTKTRKIIGWTISALMILFLVFDSMGKIAGSPQAVNATVELGYPNSAILPIGIMLLFFTILYAIPGTSIFGAILLSGYLGGAVATNVRVDAPLFSHILFPVYIGILVWLGLAYRHENLLKLLTNKLKHLPLLQENLAKRSHDQRE